MLLQVLPPQANPIERTSPRESSNRKHHQQCNDMYVYEWMKWIQFVWHKQVNKEHLLESKQIELTNLEYDSRVDLVIHKEQ